ncbi:bile acid:sodium symporter family protein [Pseudonocardia charpentierae]|uniref:Bile acid:sodium symporter family protein n=1 Tax=Pseudonocardia charpentierae TaxID=3075545 RepID=A0ABU2NHA3_9PSEU|nr:bile acid:sodium symporter family protein [Pseudonocardia sp. DSM 45834]MDT0353325.1 bile acid:sodium symporter family protein [Pseudonocardia sp. DSM 45834]
MTSPVFSILFPVLLAVVMFSLGLSLTAADFAHVLAVPRAVLITLLCQVVLLPALCFGLVVGVGLGPNLAVGMMVLAASPGGAMATVFSHLAGGDVALNITVTAINSVLAVFTLPVVVALSVGHFLGNDATVGLLADKVVQIGLVVLVPVAIGMTVRRRHPGFADRIQRPLRTTTIVAVFTAIIASIVPQRDGFLWGLTAVGLVCLLFSALSLTVGYVVPRLARIGHRQAVAAAMEMGIHNAVLAITVSISVLDNQIAAVAPAMYGALMYLPAAAFAWLAGCRARQTPRSTASEGAVEPG